MQVCSYSPFGYEGSIVDVEVDLRQGIPAVDIVGLADGAVKEARERMRSAIRNSGFDFPPERVLISLSPADLRKEGPMFDLPVVLAVLQQDEERKTGVASPDGKVFAFGGLYLDGNVERVRGVAAALQSAKERGIKHAIVPAGSGERFPDGIDVREVSDLREARDAFVSISREIAREAERSDAGKPAEIKADGGYEVNFPPVPSGEESLDNHKGGAYPLLKRAMTLAVAGGHNMLAFGSPGCGKTFAMQCMPQIMPLLSPEEQASVDRIYSLAGLSGMKSVRDGERPFRQPHQTASLEGMFGGGPKLQPGEITLAHNGVLFLDEATEFKSSIFQMLRVPLHSGAITLSRAGRSTVFPAKFRLAMAMNPCPCGNFGSHAKTCLCSSNSVSRYWKKIGTPLLNRIDVRVDVNAYLNPDNKRKLSDISVADMRSLVEKAWKVQHERQGKLNAMLSRDELFDGLSSDVRTWFQSEAGRRELSQESGTSVLRLARTISDMTGERDISIDRIKEVFLYHGDDIGQKLERRERDAVKDIKSVSRDDDGWGY